jgi:hypothetical protein
MTETTLICFAIEDGAQLFAIEPGPGGALSGGLADQDIEVGARFCGQAMAILEQHPAQSFEARIAPLFAARVWSRAVEACATTEVICWGRALCVAKCSAKRAMVLTSRPSVTNTTLRSLASAAMVK